MVQTRHSPVALETHQMDSIANWLANEKIEKKKKWKFCSKLQKDKIEKSMKKLTHEQRTYLQRNWLELMLCVFVFRTMNSSSLSRWIQYACVFAQMIMLILFKAEKIINDGNRINYSEFSIQMQTEGFRPGIHVRLCTRNANRVHNVIIQWCVFFLVCFAHLFITAFSWM